MLRTAVIGVGAMGRNHARIYTDLDGVDLVAIVDIKKDLAAEVAYKYRCEPYSDYRRLLSQSLDLVSIVVPTGMHAPIARDFVNAGINVLVEKPIASSVEDAKQLVSLAQKKGIKLMVGHIERFNPAIIELKARIDRGQLGKVFKIDVNRVGPFPLRIRDVGVVIDLAVHDIDIIRYLTGSEISRVYAETEHRIHTEHHDLLAGLMKCENGTICNLNINWLTPTKIRKLYITGEKGMFVVDYLRQDLYFYENAELINNMNYADIMRGVSEGTMMRFTIKKKEPLLAEIEHMVDCVKNGREPIVTGMDGIKALEIAHRLIRSAGENV
jgi:predicted dehydrogenase